MRLLRSARAGIAMACVSTLVAAPLLVPTASSAVSAEAATQSITIKVAKKTITIRGAQGLDAGRVKVEVKGAGTAEIVMFKRGYDAKDFAKDLAATVKGDMKALKRGLARTQFIGGFEAGGSGTVLLPKAGDYSVYSFASRDFAEFSAGGVKKAPTPKTDGKIIGKAGPKWGGSSELPAKGTFLFKNADQTVPHMIFLQKVVEGTTTDQVLEYLQAEEGPPPSFMLPVFLETASISSGRSITVDYDLPPGQYVIQCFFPDPNHGGMQHAFMGMLKMITLT